MSNKCACDNCHGNCQETSFSSKNGVFCRSCNEFNEFAEPDYISDDGKFTCYGCGTHPDRRYKGIADSKRYLIFKKYELKK